MVTKSTNKFSGLLPEHTYDTKQVMSSEEVYTYGHKKKYFLTCER